MTIADIAELIGYLATAWVLGFAGGYSLTQFVRGMNSLG